MESDRGVVAASVKEGLSRDVTLSRDPNEVKEPECRSLGKIMETKGEASAKGLRQVCFVFGFLSSIKGSQCNWE